MHQSFSIKNYRCFQDFTIQGLKRVNLIAGKNNSGKTSLLEALFLHSGYFNPELLTRVNVFRGIKRFKNRSPKDHWASLFHCGDTALEIQLTSNAGEKESAQLAIAMKKSPNGTISQVYDNGENGLEDPQLQATSMVKNWHLSMKYNDPASGLNEVNARLMEDGTILVKPGDNQDSKSSIMLPTKHRSFTEDAERFSELEKKGKTKELLDTLKILEPRLQRLAVLILAGDAIICGDIGLQEMLPLAYMGEGMTNMLTILLAIAEAKGGKIFVDEVENGLHHSVLPQVWTAIGAAAKKYDVQIFATTHSWECIEAAHQAFTQADEYDLAVHRLETRDGKIHAVSMDEESLEVIIEEGFEIR